MTMINRYVHQVELNLPRKQRPDVAAELRSLLQDMVEDRSQTTIKQADEAVVAEVLQEMGQPEKVAASYRSAEPYLIGPKIFPMFKMVFFIVAAAVAGATLLATALSLLDGQLAVQDFVRAIVRLIPDYLENMLGVLGLLVIIFTILQRFIPDLSLHSSTEPWNPSQLPPINDPARLKHGELIIELAFSAFALILLNFFRSWLGFSFFENGERVRVALFSPNFYTNLLPWINVVLVVAIGLAGWELYKNKLSRPSQTLRIAYTLFSMFVLYLLITHAPILGVSGDWVAEKVVGNSGSAEDLAETTRLFKFGFAYILPLVMLIHTISLGKHAWLWWRLEKTA